MRSHIYIDRGDIREGKTRFGQTESAATPTADTMEVFPDDTLATLAARAYGANTPGNRARIRRANASLEGTINVPR